jgi:hypothetical protein
MRDALLRSIAEKRGVEKLAGWLVQYVAQSRFFFASLQDPKGKQHTRTRRLDFLAFLSGAKNIVKAGEEARDSLTGGLG